MDNNNQTNRPDSIKEQRKKLLDSAQAGRMAVQMAVTEAKESVNPNAQKKPIQAAPIKPTQAAAAPIKPNQAAAAPKKTEPANTLGAKTLAATPREADKPQAQSLRQKRDEQQAEKNLQKKLSDTEQKRMKLLFFSLLGVTLAILIAFVLFLILRNKEYTENNDPSPDTTIQEIGFFNGENVLAQLCPNVPEGTAYPEGIQEKYKPLYAASKHFVGWLRVPNTCIDTAIYQASNNDYFIKGDLKGNYSRYGIPFADYRNDMDELSVNTVIYGHNFDDNQDGEYDDIIFGDIEKYLNVEFYKNNPVIEFNTLYRDYKWKVFACFLTNGSNSGDVDANGNSYLFYYVAPNMSNENFLAFANEVQQRSLIKTSVDIAPTDKVLTLSTCTYQWDRNGHTQDARCVLMARLVREGEAETVDTSTATQNENPRYPQLYYNIFGGSNPFKSLPRWYPDR